MENFKVLFKGIHIGNLTVNGDMYSYKVNPDMIKEISMLPIFDTLKEDFSSKNIPFFKVRLEKGCYSFETDDYELVPLG